MNNQAFLDAVQAAVALPTRKETERWVKAVAGALVDVAPDSETRRQLIAQLPGFLKSYLTERRPSGLLMSREALIQHVGAALDVHAPEAERALLTVWGVMRRAVSEGERADFEARVPKDIAAFLHAA